MPKNPVNISWKNEASFQTDEGQRLLALFGGPMAISQKFKQPIAHFLEQADIFVGEPMHLKDGEPAYAVTIDFKELKQVHDARGHTPLEVLHQKGHIVTMFLRPDINNPLGLLFKLCPQELICDMRGTIAAAKQFNRSPWHVMPKNHPSWAHRQDAALA
jgi:hypothetical protein